MKRGSDLFEIWYSDMALRRRFPNSKPDASRQFINRRSLSSSTPAGTLLKLHAKI
jgi:hypothetical protein